MIYLFIEIKPKHCKITYVSFTANRKMSSLAVNSKFMDIKKLIFWQSKDGGKKSELLIFIAERCNDILIMW